MNAIIISLVWILTYCPVFLLATDYSAYPAQEILTNKIAKVDITSNPTARAFRTKLQGAVGQNVDFAGRYKVICWGAGTMAETTALVDVKNGKVHLAPFTAALGVQYRVNSRLMLENDPSEVKSYIKDHGGLKPPWLKTSYWLWDIENERFTEIE